MKTQLKAYHKLHSYLRHQEKSMCIYKIKIKGNSLNQEMATINRFCKTGKLRKLQIILQVIIKREMENHWEIALHSS